MLVAGCIGFSQEGQCVVDPGQLRCLAYLCLRTFVGPFDNSLPNVSGEGLVGVCGRS